MSLLLTINITMNCSLGCEYCTNKKWLNTNSTIQAQDLILYLAAKRNEYDYIEITGGEPSEYDDIDCVLRWLSYNKVPTIIRTNGLKPLPKLPFMHRISAWHDNTTPLYYDALQIIKKEGYEIKEEFAKLKKVPYMLSRFAQPHKEHAYKGGTVLMKCPIDLIATIHCNGAVAACPVADGFHSGKQAFITDNNTEMKRRGICQGCTQAQSDAEWLEQFGYLTIDEPLPNWRELFEKRCLEQINSNVPNAEEWVALLNKRDVNPKEVEWPIMY